jgi:hypothetical protein
LNEDCVEAARSLLGSVFADVLTSRKTWLNVLWNDASGSGMSTSINSSYLDIMFALTSRLEGNGCAWFIQVAGCHGGPLVDGAIEEGRGEWEQIVKSRIRQRITEPYSPWQNRAEGEMQWTAAIRRFTAMTCRYWVDELRRKLSLEILLTCHNMHSSDGISMNGILIHLHHSRSRGRN